MFCSVIGHFISFLQGNGGIGSALAAVDGVMLAAVHLLFQQAQKPGGGEGEHEVNGGDDGKGFEIAGIGAGGRFTHKEKFADGNHVQHTAVLDIDHKFVADGGHDIAHRLGQHHMHHGLPMGHADGMGGFLLALVHTDDAAADDLRHVCAGIDGDDEDGEAGSDLLALFAVVP